MQFLRLIILWKYRYSLAIFFFAGFSYLLCLDHGLPNYGETWAADGDPLHSVIVFKNVYLDGWNTGFHHLGYPDFHRILVFLFQAPYLCYQYLAGNLSFEVLKKGFPYDKYTYQLIYRDLGLINRAVSVIMALGMLFWVGKTAEYLKNHTAKLWATFLIGASPAVIYYVHTDTLDVPMLFWLAVAIYYYVRALDSATIRDHVILGALAAVSTSTKYYAYGAFVLMPIPLIYMKWKEHPNVALLRRICAATLDRRHLYGALAFVATLLLTENILWNPTGFVRRLDHALALSDETTSVNFQRDDWVSVGRLVQLAEVLPFVLGWPGAVLAVWAVLLSLWNGHRKVFSLAWPLLGIYFFTIVPTLDESGRIERPFMPLALLLSITIGYEMGALWQAVTVSKYAAVPLLRICSLATIVLIAANAVAVDALLMKDTRYAVEQYFQRIPGDKTVAVFGYRRQSPRLYRSRQSWVLNHRRQWYSRDVQINDRFDPTLWAEQNAPAYVVLATNYVDGFSGELADHPAARRMRSFFNSLRNGDQRYVLARQYHPFLGPLFGMPHDREQVPRLEIYVRRDYSHE